MTLGKTSDLCLGPARVSDGGLSAGGQGSDVLGEYLEIRERVRVIAPGGREHVTCQLMSTHDGHLEPEGLKFAT